MFSSSKRKFSDADVNFCGKVSTTQISHVSIVPPGEPSKILAILNMDEETYFLVDWSGKNIYIPYKFIVTHYIELYMEYIRTNCVYQAS